MNTLFDNVIDKLNDVLDVAGDLATRWKRPFPGNTVSVRTVDADRETVDVSLVKIVSVKYGYGRPEWMKVYGTVVNTGEFISFWSDDIVWSVSLLSDGTMIEECA